MSKKEFKYKDICFEKDNNHIKCILYTDWYDYRSLEKIRDLKIIDKNNKFITIQLPNSEIKLLECSDMLNNISLNRSLNYVPPQKIKLSCIILLTANALFVKNFLIPSIIQHTKTHFEIILVINGPKRIGEKIIEKYPKIKVIHSEEYWISRGYNQGVKAATGQYIAIFHDDVLIKDDEWFEKAKALLDHENIAVSPEIQTEYFDKLKVVPLIMEKKMYEMVGGFDEYQFCGAEDLDFTTNLLSKGYRFKKVSFDSQHFHGMTTICLYADYDYEPYFGYNLIPENIIEEINTYFVNKLKNSALQLILYNYHKRIMKKHRDYLLKNKKKELYECLKNAFSSYKSAKSDKENIALLRLHDNNKPLFIETLKKMQFK